LFDPNTIRKILVVKLDHLGDCVGAVKAIKRLKHVFPWATIQILAGTWTEQLWALVPEIAGVIPLNFFQINSDLPHRQFLPAELDVLRGQLGSHRFDLAVDFRRQPDTRMLLRYAGARYTAGFDDKMRFSWLDIALTWEEDVVGVSKRQHFADALV